MRLCTDIIRTFSQGLGGGPMKVRGPTAYVSFKFRLNLPPSKDAGAHLQMESQGRHR